MRITLKNIICFAIALVVNTSTMANTMSVDAHPRDFCDLAKDVGYPSRGYKESTGGCASNMIEVTNLPGGNGLKNNLAFYSMGEYGNSSKLQRASLILNVNNTAQKDKAQAELNRVASAVASKIFGKVPNGLKETILKARTKSWTEGEWSIEVKTTVWPTGQGQDTTVYFRAKKE